MKNSIDRKLVHLDGTPFNCGLIHGKTLKDKIHRVVEVWKKELGKFVKTDPEPFLKQFLQSTDYISAIEQYTPNLLEEVKGISEGSGIDFDTMFAFQLLDELLLNGATIKSNLCSCIGINRISDKPPYLAQNWDIGGYMNGFQTVLHIKDHDTNIESYLFSYAGFIAALGANNKRIGVCVNSLPQLNYATEGLPVAFIIRGVLSQANQDAAVKFLHDIKHASPQNYLIGGPDRILDFECSSNKTTPFAIADDADVVYHTNHAIANDDYSQMHLDFLKTADKEEIESDNSHTRLKALEKRLSIPAEEITLDMVKETLSSKDSDAHPVCMSFKDTESLYSLGSAAMVLSDQLEFHIALGAPDANPYNIHTFSN